VNSRPAEPIVYVNGRFVPESQATISVFDHVVLYGDGAFETAVAWRGSVFKLDAHLDRLSRSLAALALPAPHTTEELREIVLETIRRNDLQDAYVKILVTRGSNGTPLLDPTGCDPGCVVLVRPYLYMASSERIARGLRLKTVAVRRPSADVLDPHIKSLNYLNLVLAKIEARAAQVDEALLLDSRGSVCECPGYNVFAVHGEHLRTPWQDILEGITRETVLELAPAVGLRVAESTLELYDLYTADEVFLCSTAGGIVPVREVDGRPIGTGEPGEVFTSIRDAYLDLLASGAHGTPIFDAVTAADADGRPG
jgi:branched-chain amino acid aminotransferase